MNFILLAFFFFFKDTATTEIYTLSLHDALPISPSVTSSPAAVPRSPPCRSRTRRDRKSTRLNSSHVAISYAGFCLNKKNAYMNGWCLYCIQCQLVVLRFVQC